MYSAVGDTQLLESDARRRQWDRAVASLRAAAEYAGDRAIKLAVEPLNRFETDSSTRSPGPEARWRYGSAQCRAAARHVPYEHRGKGYPRGDSRAAGRIVEFHASSNDRGTPGKDHLPWPQIAKALRAAGYQGPVVIEAFTPEIREITKAVSIWRPLAASQDALATDGLKHLRAVFQG